MILKEFFVKLGLTTDAQSFAKGQLAVDALKFGLGQLAEVARNVINGLGEAFIGFNSRAEDAKLKLAAIATVNLSMPFTEAQDAAATLYDQLQEDAARTTASTEELVDFAGQIARPILAAGAAMSDLREFTTQAVVAAKTMGLSGTAGFDLEQAIEGRAGIKDRFAKFLIQDVGKMSLEKFKGLGGGAGTKKGNAERMKLLQEWLNAPALKELVAAQEGTWSGIMNGITDNFAKTLGAIGKPFFEALKEPLKLLVVLIQKAGPPIVKFFNALFVVLRAGYRVLEAVAKAIGAVIGWFYKAGPVMGTMLTVLSALLVAAALFGGASVAAALASAAAWALAALPVLLLVALFGLIILVIEDLYVGLNGGRSLIFDLVNAWGGFIDKWLTDHGLGWLGEALKSLWAWITNFGGQLDNLWTGIKDGIRALGTWIENLFAGVWQKIKDGAQSVVDAVNPFAEGAKFTLDRALSASITPAFATLPGAGGGASSAPVTVSIGTIQTSGTPEDVKKAVGQAVDEALTKRNREALEYFGGSSE